MGPLSTCLLQSLPGFIRFKGVTKSSTICYMKTRSLQHSHGPNVNSLDTGSLLRIPPILSDSPFAKQNTTRLSTHSNIDNTLLANTVVVSTSVGNTNKENNSSTQFKRPFSRSKRESSFISVQQRALILVAWQVSGSGYLSRDFLRKQPSLFPSQEGKVIQEITNWSGRSGLPGMTHGNLIHFSVL